jgi:hypothetical protein
MPKSKTLGMYETHFPPDNIIFIILVDLPYLFSSTMISIHVMLMQDDVKGMVEKFLEYVMNTHRVKIEGATILQAFQISLVRIFSHSFFNGKEKYSFSYLYHYLSSVCL